MNQNSQTYFSVKENKIALAEIRLVEHKITICDGIRLPRKKDYSLLKYTHCIVVDECSAFLMSRRKSTGTERLAQASSLCIFREFRLSVT